MTEEIRPVTSNEKLTDLMMRTAAPSPLVAAGAESRVHFKKNHITENTSPSPVVCLLSVCTTPTQTDEWTERSDSIECA